MGVTTRVQFNPSTLKAMRNVATGKVMTTRKECDHCADGAMPSTITVSVADLVDYGCCDRTAVDPYSRVLADDEYKDCAANINGQSFELSYSGDPCVYSKCFYKDPGKWASMVAYNSTDGSCTDETSSADYPYLGVWATLVADGVEIRLIVNHDIGGCPIYTGLLRVFDGKIAYTGDDACGRTNNSASNDITACWDGHIYGLCAGTGTVTITTTG